MHVLMTADSASPMWKYALTLSRELTQLGIRISLALTGSPLNPVQLREAAQIPRLAVHTSELHAEHGQLPAWLLQLCRQVRPDLLHLNHLSLDTEGCEVPVVVAAHECRLSWWQAVKGRYAPDSEADYSRRVRNNLQKAEAVIAGTQDMIRQLEHHYGRLRHSRVIPLGIDSNGISSAPKQSLIISCGTEEDEAKNTALLADISSKIPWATIIYEENPDFSAASVFVLPARYEPSGLSVLEAAATGCALVLGNVAELREQWQEAALFVNPENPEALEGILLTIIENPWLCRELSARAQQRARQFTAKRMGLGYMEIYQQVTGSDAVGTITPLSVITS